MAASIGIHGLRPSPALESITDTLYQNFNLQIDKAVSTGNSSHLDKPMEDYVKLMEVAPNHLSYLVEKGSFYSVLTKYVSQGQYDSVIAFMHEFLEKPNSEVFITDEVLLCFAACQLAIDPLAYHDICAQLIQETLQEYPEFYQHFDALMLSDPAFTEFYRPLAQFFKQ